MKLVDTTIFFAGGSGGVSTYLERKHDVLADYSDIEHEIVYPGADFHFSQGLMALPAPSLPLASGYRFPFRLNTWASFIAGLQPDIIEAGDPYTPAWSAKMAGRMLDVPVVGFYHSDLAALVSSRLHSCLESATRAYLRKLYNGFDRVLAPSAVMAEKLDHCGVRGAHVQPLGVDLDTFSPKKRNLALREQKGIPVEAKLLVFAGRGAREKNIPVLLRAMDYLGDDYHLMLIGSGMPVQAPPNVHVIDAFCSPQEVSRWLAAADAMLHAGDQETFGLVALEGMASGLPVIFANGGALPEVVPDHCGRPFKAGDAKALAGTIEDLFERDDPAKIGRQARAYVEAHHGWPVIVEQLLGHYHALLGTTHVALRNTPKHN